MRLFFIYITLFLLFPFALLSQQDSTAARKPVPKESRARERAKSKLETQKAGNKAKFVDADGNGIDDNLENPDNSNKPRHQKRMMEQKRQRMKDRFIDKDGDGVNDNRCGGMGLGHKKARQRRGGR